MSLQGHRKEVISYGPWGGQGGINWDDGMYSHVRQIEIAHGAGIDSIKIEYDKNGTSVWSEKHGGNGGSRTDKIRLAYPDEFLTSLHGHYGSSKERGPSFTRSLTFRTNRRTYGPYGVEQGTPFSLPMSQGKIVGFHGKAGWFLDAIGVHFEPLQTLLTPNALFLPQSHVSHATENYEYSMIQGSLGKNFDVVVAIKNKNETHNFSTDYHQKQNFSTDYHPKQTAKLEEINQTDHKNKNETIMNSKVEPKVEKLPSKKVQGVVALGPWGGTGGTLFDDGVYDGIRQINISRNVGIVYIRVCYELNGQPVWGSKNGGTGGFKYDKIVFDFPSEILTHITGYHGPTMGMGPTIIKSLTFHTTKGKYGPYGEERGQSFTTNTKNGIIVGFHGREGLFLDALGVHLLEGKALPVIRSPSKHVSQSPVAALPVISSPSKHMSQSPVAASPVISSPLKPVSQSPVAAAHHEGSNMQWSFKLGKKGLTEETAQRVRVDPTPWGPGPWGGDGGKPWDDGVFTGIKQIVITGADLGICCMEIEYDRNGQSVWSVKHGGSGGRTTHRVKLDYPNEVLTCVSGYYGPISKDHTSKVIKSLTFHTTRQKFGPFGEELGTYFTSNTTEGKVVGFHGKSGIYLDAVGVHMQHWLGHQRAKQSSSLMKMFY